MLVAAYAAYYTVLQTENLWLGLAVAILVGHGPWASAWPLSVSR